MKTEPSLIAARSINTNSGRLDAVQALQLGVDLLCCFPTELAGSKLGDGADLVFHEGRVDELCPNAENVDRLLIKVLKAPGAVGFHRQLGNIVSERVVEVDLHESRWEDPDASKVEQLDPAVRPHGVVAEMRIAVDDS